MINDLNYTQVPTAAKYGTALLYGPFVFLMETLQLDQDSMSVLTVLVLIDIFTGVMKTLALGKKPSSRRLLNGFISKVLLLLVPIVFALAVKGIGVDAKSMLYMILSVLILSETYSIIGNVYTVKTRKEVEEFDAVAVILKMIRKYLDRLTDINDSTKG